jgi:hypothetical protein
MPFTMPQTVVSVLLVNRNPTGSRPVFLDHEQRTRGLVHEPFGGGTEQKGA